MDGELHPRYGDLNEIAALTDSRCHLCGDGVDLGDYGPPGTFGRRTVTIDHLEPQAFGGGDELENLRLAHASCNSSRGVRPAEDVRWELTGSESEPWSEGAWVLATVAAAGAAGKVAHDWGGVAFAKPDEHGLVRFNQAAASWSGLAGLLLAAWAVSRLRG